MLVKKNFLAPSVNVSGLTRRALRESVVLPLNNPHATKLARPVIAKSPLFQPLRGRFRVGPRFKFFFGGFGRSGIGREGIKHAIAAMTEPKSFIVNNISQHNLPGHEETQ